MSKKIILHCCYVQFLSMLNKIRWAVINAMIYDYKSEFKKSYTQYILAKAITFYTDLTAIIIVK